MSQLSFESTYHGAEAHVVAGWDAFEERFFLSVFEGDSDDVIWYDGDYYGSLELRNTKVLRQALTKLNIQTPPDFWDKCEEKGEACEKFVNGKWARDW